jgi:hypothetical protein
MVLGTVLLPVKSHVCFATYSFSFGTSNN